MTQLDIFTAPYQTHSETSREAAEFIAPKIGPLQSKVLAFIRLHGPCTDAQIIDGIGLSPNSVRPRRIELAKSGRVQQAGTITQSNGRRAATWMAA